MFPFLYLPFHFVPNLLFIHLLFLVPVVEREADDVIEPDQKLFNLMIYSYGKCGKVEEAKKLMVEMKALNVSLSVVTYNSLLSCNPSVKDAETVFHQVKNSTPTLCSGILKLRTAPR